MRNKNKKHLKYHFSNLSLQMKMVLIFFVLLLVPLGVFTFYSSSRVKTVVRDQTFSAAQKTFAETAASIQTRISKATAVMDSLVYDKKLYSMASTDPKDYPYILQWEDQRLIAASFRQLELLSEVSKIRFYVRNNYLYSTENQYIFSLNDVSNTNWYRNLVSTGTPKWFTPMDFADDSTDDTSPFSYARVIYDPSSLLSPMAIQRIDLDQSVLKEAISDSSTTENGMVLLFSEDQIVLSYCKNENSPVLGSISEALQQVEQDQWVPISVEGISYYVYSTALPPTPWHLVTIIPFSDISVVSNELQSELLTVMLLVAIIAFCLSIILSKQLLRRIHQLTDTIQKVESGDVQVHLSSRGNDEVERLIAHFNHMMGRIQQLMEEKVSYGIEIKNLELKALQAQINPHFLYNTLETINCLALQKDIPEISDLVSALATFYKISLSKGKDVISIHNEILHAKMYLCIQNYRFENQITSQWDIDPDIENNTIIKIILQPIIENALIHGIFEKEDSTGHIAIRGWQENGDIYIDVHDDGVGMTQEEIDANFKASESSGIPHTPGGYGIQNINDRLRIAYGPAYGLSCQSQRGTGTTVTIHIPACNASS